MGLTERRAVKAFKESRFPDLQEDIQKAAGCPVEVEVDWDKLAVEGQAERYPKDDFWILIFFRPTAAALSEITFDDLGKEAVKEGLKKIVFTYDPLTAPSNDSPEGVSFDDGVLRVNFVPGVNAGDEQTTYFRDRAYAIRRVLEQKL